VGFRGVPLLKQAKVDARLVRLGLWPDRSSSSRRQGLQAHALMSQLANRFVSMGSNLRGARGRQGKKSLSMMNWKNAKDFSGCICQTEAVRFPPGVALSYFTSPTFGASNHLGFARQNRGLLIDGNTFSEPINSKHPRLLLSCRVHPICCSLSIQKFAVQTFRRLAATAAYIGEVSQGTCRKPRKLPDHPPSFPDR
jgi:hypothetical protein